MALNKKICIVGAFSVGKTSLVRRYVLNEFSPDYQATLGVNVYKYSDQVAVPGDGAETVNQIIWDIEGSELGVNLLATYLGGASGALIVGDVTREDCIESMAAHARRFLEIRPGRPVVFACNKIDLLDTAGAGPDSTALSDEFAGPVVDTSAADGTAVPELFRALASRMLEIGA